jgi:membrane peptidoglycan carboxypeptidase
MATAFSTFANDGVHREPYVIERVVLPDGRELTGPDRPEERVLTSEQNSQVVYALRQVVDGGTATGARLPNSPAAGKTGTTTDNTDAWFVGFTPNGLTAAVWMGYEPDDTDGDGIGDTARSMSDVHGRSVTGGSFPATIWRAFMTEWVELANEDPGRFPSVTFTGTRVLGSDITTTTSSIPPCTEGQVSSEDAPCETTTTSSTDTTAVDPTATTAVDPTATTVPQTEPPPTDPATTVPPATVAPENEAPPPDVGD